MVGDAVGHRFQFTVSRRAFAFEQQIDRRVTQGSEASITLDTIGGRRFGGCCPHDSTAVHSALRTNSHPPSRRRAIATAVLERAPKAQKGRRPQKRKRPSLWFAGGARVKDGHAFSEAVETPRGSLSTKPWGGHAGTGAAVPFVSTMSSSRNEPRSVKGGPGLSWRLYRSGWREATLH